MSSRPARAGERGLQDGTGEPDRTADPVPVGRVEVSAVPERRRGHPAPGHPPRPWKRSRTPSPRTGTYARPLVCPPCSTPGVPLLPTHRTPPDIPHFGHVRPDEHRAVGTRPMGRGIEGPTGPNRYPSAGQCGRTPSAPVPPEQRPVTADFPRRRHLRAGFPRRRHPRAGLARRRRHGPASGRRTGSPVCAHGIRVTTAAVACGRFACFPRRATDMPAHWPEADRRPPAPFTARVRRPHAGQADDGDRPVARGPWLAAVAVAVARGPWLAGSRTDGAPDVRRPRGSPRGDRGVGGAEGR